MASLRVYAPVDGGRVIKLRIAAQYAGVELKFVEDFKFGVTNKSAEFLAKFPLGKIPAVETPYGPLTESGAIARYIARINPAAGLLGGSFYEQSLVDQWIDFAVTELEALLGKWLAPVWGMGAFDQATYDSAKETFTKLISYLDAHLVSNTFVAGDSITLADISLFAALKFYFGNVVTESDAAPYTSVLRWWNTLLAQKQFAAVVPDFKFCTQEKYAAGNPKAAAAAAAAPAAAAAAETKAAPAAEKKAEAAPVAEKAAPAPKEEAKKGKGKKEDKPKAEAKAEAAPAPAAAAAPVAAAAPATPEPKKAEAPKSAKKEPKAEAPKTPKAEAKKEAPKSAKKGGKK